MNGVIAGKYYESAKLNVGTNNVTAKALYERYGFVVKHEVPNFYNSDSAYCMKCNLTAPVPYSRKQIPVQITAPISSTEDLPNNTNTKENTNQKNNQGNNQSRKGNNNASSNKKANTNRKNQSEPAQTTHLVNIEPIGFQISAKPKEYS
jgi:hypothetical protein